MLSNEVDDRQEIQGKASIEIIKLQQEEEIVTGISEESVCLLSKLLYNYAAPVFRKASSLNQIGEGLNLDDLLPLINKDKAAFIFSTFDNAWKEYGDQVKSKESSSINERNKGFDVENSKTTDISQISFAIKAVLGRPFWIAGGIKMINSILQFTYPFLLNEIIRYIEEVYQGEIDFDSDSNWDKYRGYWFSVILFAAIASKALTVSSFPRIKFVKC